VGRLRLRRWSRLPVQTAGSLQECSDGVGIRSAGDLHEPAPKGVGLRRVPAADDISEPGERCLEFGGVVAGLVVTVDTGDGR
jgi:hypothetical protein